MTSSTPQSNSMTTALRMAYGPGYGFGGPSDIQFRTIVKMNSAANTGRRR